MRFTKIPLIAILLAGALSLLFLLPAVGQTSGEIERTEGRVTSGDLQVGVYASVADAQAAKLVQDTYGTPPRTFYRLPTTETTATGLTGSITLGNPIVSLTAGEVTNDNPAFGFSPYTSTRNTFFDGSLYIGGGKAATYSTALITLHTDTVANACEADPDDANAPDNVADYPVAQVSNPSRGYTIDVPLLPAAFPEDRLPMLASGKTYAQAFFEVVDDNDSDLTNAQKEEDGRDCFYYRTGDTDIAAIGARHGDRLTVRITGQASNISLIVDAEGPEINLISPADTSVVRSNDLSFRFDVRDPDSGLRHDGEYTLSEDGDPTSVNPDRDANRGSEPRSEPTASLFGVGNGKAADIQAVYWSIEDANSPVGTRLDLPDATRADDITDQGTWSIIGGRAGVGYSFSATGNNFDSAENALQFTAMDRVGNMTTSDAELDSAATDEPYIFEVDDDKPTITNLGVRTGISYDNADSAEEVNRSAIALMFSEPIKSGDVEVSRISVAGNSVTGVVQPNGAPIVYRATSDTRDTLLGDPSRCTLGDEVDHDEDNGATTADVPNTNKCPGKDIEGAAITDTRSLVFLQLRDALDADADPAVTLLSGAVQDLAGNAVDTTSLKAADWIAPTLAVSVTGTKGDRPVANEDGAFVVEVTSDEELSGRPRVVFAQVQVNNPDADEKTYSIGTNVSGQTGCNLTPQETDLSWRRSCGVGEQIDSAITGMVGVFVLAKDEDDNLAVVPVGWTANAGDDNEPGHRASGRLPSPMSTNAVDVQKLQDAGLLIEIDNIFNSDGDDTAPEQQAPAESVTPQSGDDQKKTESPNPFIHIDFQGEASEYNQGDFKDSHGTVTITEIKLDDDDAADRLSRVDKDEFSVVLRDLAVGKYTLTYKAEDDAGNKYDDGEFKFEVLARKPYKVSVKPGWNLISLPGAPENSGIADVLSGTEFLTPVLAYQNGDWLTARRADDGWDGSLTDIEAGYGYWVHAQTFETISTLLTEIDPASVPPTVPVTRGWNLLGVIDVDQRAVGSPPGGDGENADEADNYFGSIPWKVAYAYKTQESVWVRTTPDGDTTGCSDDDDDTECENEIANGNGYWVWSERPSTLVP